MNTSIKARESEFGHNYTVVGDGSHGYQQPESESATRSAHLLRHFSISTMVGDPTYELSLHVVTEALVDETHTQGRRHWQIRHGRLVTWNTRIIHG